MSTISSFFARSLLALAVLATAAPALASRELPLPVQETVSRLKALGEGRMRWFGIHLYDATLWVSGGQFDPRQPFALDIRYARDIPRERLVESSVSEMRRLGFGRPEALERWGRKMGQVFPDVRQGDRLVGLYVPGQGARFFSDKGFLGAVEEDAFAEAFFAIWLDFRTREPSLRASLLGLR